MLLQDSPAYDALLGVARLLLSKRDPSGIAEALFRTIAEATRATRGFVVLRDEGGALEVRLEIDFDAERVSPEEHKFSRSLVRRALANGAPVHSEALALDARFAEAESVDRLGARAALALPLGGGDSALGALYLEKAPGAGPFDAAALRFATDCVELGALTILSAVERQRLSERAASLERDLFKQHDFRGIITQHPAMIELLRVVAQIAPSSAPVLLRGETGTGKELLARAIHANSGRRDGPFVVVHCAALPSSVLEAELFGHTRGAFTGAYRDRSGRIAAADGGTLVLDEVGEIPLDMQAKLLRFVQFGEVTRLGEDDPRKFDVRLVAVTHRDLEGMVRVGSFRQDLYYRLRVIELTLPPLRERPSDIPLLVSAIVGEVSEREGKERRLAPEALAALGRHDYPGNVRELRHAVERACLLAGDELVGVECLPPELRGAAPRSPVPFAAPRDVTALGDLRESAVRGAEREFLENLIARCDGNISRAAREAGIHRSYLQRLLTRHGLR
jgi:transcriptional regulator with GAF, ATPase, and Fis domain